MKAMEGRALSVPDVDYLGDPRHTGCTPKKQEKPFARSLPGNHAHSCHTIVNVTKILKMFFEAQIMQGKNFK